MFQRLESTVLHARAYLHDPNYIEVNRFYMWIIAKHHLKGVKGVALAHACIYHTRTHARAHNNFFYLVSALIHAAVRCSYLCFTFFEYLVSAPLSALHRFAKARQTTRKHTRYFFFFSLSLLKYAYLSQSNTKVLFSLSLFDHPCLVVITWNFALILYAFFFFCVHYHFSMKVGKHF